MAGLSVVIKRYSSKKEMGGESNGSIIRATLRSGLGRHIDGAYPSNKNLKAGKETRLEFDVERLAEDGKDISFIGPKRLSFLRRFFGL